RQLRDQSLPRPLLDPPGHAARQAAGARRRLGRARAGKANQAGPRSVSGAGGFSPVSKFRFMKGRDDYHRHFSAVDVGTELIKVLVVRREGLDGVVLGVGREPQHPEAMEAGAIASPDHVIDACNRALEASEDMAGVVPGQAVVGIAGELVKGFASAVSYPRERPDQRVRESELKNMLQMVERRALRE